MSHSPLVAAERLVSLGTRIYSAIGVPQHDANVLANSLVQADLWGHQSHGVMRLSWYAARIRSGVMQARTQAETVVDAGALALIDGHDGIGQVLASLAAREAIDRAKKHGVGVVGLRNSNHFGTAMYYTLMGARAGCVAFLSTNASAAMPPWGGKKKAVGTNPWSIAAPAGKYAPMVLDIANTAVARGKIYLARQKGIPIPLGWALDAAGEATTDPDRAIDGIILPMAEHKGYAIAMMMDVLSGVLTGSAFGTAVNGPYQFDRRSGSGHLLIALDIEAFQPLSEFHERMEQLIRQVKAVPLAKGFEEVFYPGELEARNEARNLEQGLQLPQDTLADLRKEAAAAGLASEAIF
ncbi:MAG: Ldh family oxidoreductase [Burkholderiaceae bacterium]|nr:Ldh family oxidoreductase [Burkholderiaceae bacterium]